MPLRLGRRPARIACLDEPGRFEYSRLGQTDDLKIQKGENTINHVVCVLFASLFMVGFCALASQGSVDPKKDVNVAQFGAAWLLTSEDSKPVYAPEVTDTKAETCLLYTSPSPRDRS